MRSNFYYSEVLCGILNLRAFRESPKSGENIAMQHMFFFIYMYSYSGACMSIFMMLSCGHAGNRQT